MNKLLMTVMLMAFTSPAFAAGENQIGADLSSNRGGLAIGADYNRAIQKNFGAGGYIHYFSKNSDRQKDGLFAFGGQVNVHYQIDNSYDVYVAPGFGFVNIDRAASNDTAFTAGPKLAIGALYTINDQWAVGLEYANYWSWFNAGYNGQLIEDLAIRGRITF